MDEAGGECSALPRSTIDLALDTSSSKIFSSLSAEVLEIQDNIVEEVRKVWTKLPADQIGQYGQIQEWEKDFPEQDPGHRHFSGVVGFHPGTTINPYDTPELVEGVRRFIERRLQYGGGSIGWSCAWLINLCARLGDGNSALFFLTRSVEKIVL